ncbi:MAG: hypothetical protein K6A43_13240 [Treponema sp.]|nr:hypothetical protein [Treponema sp.]
MKKNLKIGALAVLSAFIAFSFFSCEGLLGGKTRTDSKLEVNFSATGDTTSTTRKVTMTAPDKYDSLDVYIVYTTDGTEPGIEFNKDAYTAASLEGDANIVEYIDYGSAILYKEPVSFSSSAIIKAIAFYVKNETVYKGTLSEYELTVKATQTDSIKDTGTVSGIFDFNLATTGNTNATHYYDTSSSNLFKWGEYEHCYYQIQFTVKQKGKGKWYLYVRQLGNASPMKNSTGDTAFVAFGDYTGHCFDDYSKIDGIVAGDIVLSCTAGAKSYEGTVSISKDGSASGFSMKVNGTYGSAISVGDEK